VEVYDPAADTWTSLAPMSAPTRWFTAAAVKGRIYVFGGSAGRPAGDAKIASVESYNPKKDRWTRRADMPTARFGASAGVLNNRVYVMEVAPSTSSAGIGIGAPNFSRPDHT